MKKHILEIKEKYTEVNFNAFELPIFEQGSFKPYRTKYYQYLKLFSSKVFDGDEFFDLPNDLNFMRVSRVVGDEFEKVVLAHKAENVICGISGDLDSSLGLILLGKIIKDRNLKCKIIAYHFKNNFQPKRARRIEKLVKYVNANFVPVDFFSYDISVTAKLFSSEVQIFENTRIRPKTQIQMESLNKTLETLRGLSDTQNEKNPHKFTREQGPLVHELSTAIRGRILRKYPKSILIGTTNATEICVSNFTTSDLLVSFAPLVFLQKSTISKIFREAIGMSEGKVLLKDWEYTLSHLTPFFPSGLKYEFQDNSIIFTRPSNHFDFLNKVVIDLDQKDPHYDFWQSFNHDKNSFPIPGVSQYLCDKYLSYFLMNDISENKVEFLIEKYPNEKNIILLSAIIYLSARELTVKDMYVTKMFC